MNVDPQQGYNHAKFERSCYDGVREKANVNGGLLFFFSNEEMCHLCPLNVCKNKKKNNNSGTFMILNQRGT